MQDAALGNSDTVMPIDDGARRHFLVRHIPICCYWRRVWNSRVILPRELQLRRRIWVGPG